MRTTVEDCCRLNEEGILPSFVRDNTEKCTLCLLGKMIFSTVFVR